MTPNAILIQCPEFLLYSPLNQGLKHCSGDEISEEGVCFYSTVH